MLQWVSIGFVRKFVAGVPCASAGGISSLDHKIADHPVEGNPVVKAFPGQKNKIVNRLRSVLWVKLDLKCAPIGLD